MNSDDIDHLSRTIRIYNLPTGYNHELILNELRIAGEISQYIQTQNELIITFSKKEAKQASEFFANNQLGNIKLHIDTKLDNFEVRTKAKDNTLLEPNNILNNKINSGGNDNNSDIGSFSIIDSKTDENENENSKKNDFESDNSVNIINTSDDNISAKDYSLLANNNNNYYSRQASDIKEINIEYDEEEQNPIGDPNQDTTSKQHITSREVKNLNSTENSPGGKENNMGIKEYNVNNEDQNTIQPNYNLNNMENHKINVKKEDIENDLNRKNSIEIDIKDIQYDKHSNEDFESRANVLKNIEQDLASNSNLQNISIDTQNQNILKNPDHKVVIQDNEDEKALKKIKNTKKATIDQNQQAILLDKPEQYFTKNEDYQNVPLSHPDQQSDEAPQIYHFVVPDQNSAFFPGEKPFILNPNQEQPILPLSVQSSFLNPNCNQHSQLASHNQLPISKYQDHQVYQNLLTEYLEHQSRQLNKNIPLDQANNIVSDQLSDLIESDDILKSIPDEFIDNEENGQDLLISSTIIDKKTDILHDILDSNFMIIFMVGWSITWFTYTLLQSIGIFYFPYFILV